MIHVLSSYSLSVQDYNNWSMLVHMQEQGTRRGNSSVRGSLQRKGKMSRCAVKDRQRMPWLPAPRLGKHKPQHNRLAKVVFFCLSIHPSIHPSVCLHVCLSICLSARLFVYMSVCLCVCLSVCLSLFFVCPYIHLFIHLSICPSICLYTCVSVCVSVCPSIVSLCLFVYLSLCLFVSVSVCLCMVLLS